MMLNMGYVPGQGLGRELEGEIEPLPVLPTALKRKRTVSGVGYRPSQSPEPGPSNVGADEAGLSKASEGSKNVAKRPKRRHKQQRDRTVPYPSSHTGGSAEVSSQHVMEDDIPPMLEDFENIWDGQSRGAYPTPLCPFNCMNPMCQCKDRPVYEDQNHFFPGVFAGPQLPLPPWLAGNGFLPLAATLMQQGLPFSPEMAMFSPTTTNYDAGLPIQFEQDLGQDIPLPELNSAMIDSVKSNASTNTTGFSQSTAPSSREIHTYAKRLKGILSIGMPPDPDPQSDHGLYPISSPPPHDPEAKSFTMPIPSCTLVMESMPRSCRSLSFVREWAESFGTSSVVRIEFAGGKGKKKKGAKALIEFSSADVARRAWSSPRLNGDGKDQIRVWWYRIQGVGASAGVGELEEGEIGGEEGQCNESDPLGTPPSEVVQDQPVMSMPLPLPRVPPLLLPLPPSKNQRKKEKKAEQKAREKELAELMHKATAEKRRMAQLQSPEFSVPMGAPFATGLAGLSKESAPSSALSQSPEEVAQLLDEPEPMDIETVHSRSPSTAMAGAIEEEDQVSIASSRPGSPLLSRQPMNMDSPVADRSETDGKVKIMVPGDLDDSRLRPLAPVFVPRKDLSLPPKPGAAGWKAGAEEADLSQSSVASSSKIHAVGSVTTQASSQAAAHVRSPTPSSSAVPSKMATPPSEPRAMANAPKGPTYKQRVQSAKRKGGVNPELTKAVEATVTVVKKEAVSPTPERALPVKPEPSQDTGDLSKEEVLRKLVLASRRAKPAASVREKTPPSAGKPPETPMRVAAAPLTIEMPKVPMSKSSLDDLAISFITETLQTIRSPSTDGSTTVGNSVQELSPRSERGPVLEPGAVLAKADPVSQERLALVEHQRRLEEHLAATKVLMGKLERAGTRQEKDMILRLIRERNRVYEEGVSASSKENRPALKKYPSTIWPGTTRDAGILIISDDEDEDEVE
ncbi:hypothetical protein NEOLEDRAFT_1133172 [Neolentinus lepideus HHB14362 ss-1]|uniref:G-patch domain-containing protein n=1 Tax=Neolentinus lepideus HHB14362 ss-1 TaxID=1314782 RepID=A0A165STZ1_9AGAM|nr:hypothetical protein NEOLEDRAFT_1133172 [Neolentinus lepideus HHB14362 ss-1]